MIQRRKEIQIFNLSMLDMVTGALGAFMAIMVVLFPYYRKDLVQESQRLNREINRLTRELEVMGSEQAAARSENQRLQQALSAAEESNQRLEQELNVTRQKLGETEKKLAKTFVVVWIKWETKSQDVDLHILDPSGAEFYFGQKTIAGRPGTLSVDSLVGPGNEVWEIRDAPPGVYKVYAMLYATRGNNSQPLIEGRIFYRDDSTPIRGVRLTRMGDKKLVATITIKSTGEVIVENQG